MKPENIRKKYYIAGLKDALALIQKAIDAFDHPSHGPRCGAQHEGTGRTCHLDKFHDGPHQSGYTDETYPW